MTFLEKLKVIERVDQLIRMKATGNAYELAKRLDVSRRTVYDIINTMKAMGAPIEYCSRRSNFIYNEPCYASFGFNSEKITGGIMLNSFNLSLNEEKLHHSRIPCSYNHDYRDIIRTLK